MDWIVKAIFIIAIICFALYTGAVEVGHPVWLVSAVLWGIASLINFTHVILTRRYRD